MVLYIFLLCNLFALRNWSKWGNGSLFHSVITCYRSVIILS